MGWTSDQCKRERARAHGRNRAAFWRALGWPNLARATAAHVANAAARRAAKLAAAQDEIDPPPIDKVPR